uniref:SH3-containing GRB2-like protein 3-interacting protein 1 n=1 Tax=Anthurium amnicola TaxID=1678845 RepID=A0A1D1Y961_9ARAE
MACLALALQPSNGSDILLQTREWFPPARALVALSSFRQTRLAFSPGKQPASSAAAAPPTPSDDLDSALGDDPLAASSGQVLVGVESKYRVVYRLVNGIYVLGITTADRDGDGHGQANNLFECINTVNQAVSVVVAACRGVDVTPEKLYRKYPEIYLALDIVLRGVGAVRLANILSSIHGEGIAKMVHTAVDAENRVRGAETWAGGAEAMAAERQATLEAFSNARFELPPETLAAGDEVAVSIAPVSDEQPKDQQKPAEEAPEEKDPFAASEAVNKPPEEALVGGFKKSKDAPSSSDPTSALAGLEITALPPAAATKSTFVGVEGFEGDYGGIEFSNEEATLSETFEGFDNSFGGGLDPSEFLTATKKTPKDSDSAVLQLLTTGQSKTPGPAENGTSKDMSLENQLVTKTEMKGPEMYISEEISAEFRESLLARVGLHGIVYLKTLPPKQSGGKETEFSFQLESTPGVKRVVMQASHVSSLGNGIFHVRTPSVEEPIPLLKFSLQPRFTPIPLRVRVVKRHSGTLLSVMIQYASNPELSVPLSDVTFILKLPVDPSLLTVSPKAVLSREERELRWHVSDIPLKGLSGCLRARMPVDQDSRDGEVEVIGTVKFSAQGLSTLSGVSIRPISEGNNGFYLVNNRYASGNYLCN